MHIVKGYSIPSGWIIGNLYEISNFTNGITCQKYPPNNDNADLRVIKIREMHAGTFSEDSEFVHSNVPSKIIIKDGDILFSWSASLEVMRWFGGKGALNQHIFKVDAKPPYTNEFVYHTLSNYIVKFVAMAEARKTTMGHITTDHIEQSTIVIPPAEIINKFTNNIIPIHKKIAKLQVENRHLIALRDELLPVLMNGQVSICD
ncbi:Type I restriction modification DNA specificity domain-containing protein [Lachnospiraceae bacterium]|nr:Type I restriction modification DNA specificity domain-containing protein [Lachnospiraceae bacterium]